MDLDEDNDWISEALLEEYKRVSDVWPAKPEEQESLTGETITEPQHADPEFNAEPAAQEHSKSADKGLSVDANTLEEGLDNPVADAQKSVPDANEHNPQVDRLEKIIRRIQLKNRSFKKTIHELEMRLCDLKRKTAKPVKKPTKKEIANRELCTDANSLEDGSMNLATDAEDTEMDTNEDGTEGPTPEWINRQLETNNKTLRRKYLASKATVRGLKEDYRKFLEDLTNALQENPGKALPSSMKEQIAQMHVKHQQEFYTQQKHIEVQQQAIQNGLKSQSSITSDDATSSYCKTS
ncbi:hypothetical protein ABW21_db0205633 [Orbilia brochopaga]|nr:hypothetical protein ABW21_db0205633 [Drechslerella brochopaga]